MGPREFTIDLAATSGMRSKSRFAASYLLSLALFFAFACLLRTTNDSSDRLLHAHSW